MPKPTVWVMMEGCTQSLEAGGHNFARYYFPIHSGLDLKLDAIMEAGTNNRSANWRNMN